MSAFDPSSTTVSPFTVTRPATMSSSAFRRLVTPACDRIFCNRSSAIFRRRFGVRGGRRWLPRLLSSYLFSSRGSFRLRFHDLPPSQFLEFLVCPELASILEAEIHPEFLCCLFQDRLADQ